MATANKKIEDIEKITAESALLDRINQAKEEQYVLYVKQSPVSSRPRESLLKITEKDGEKTILHYDMDGRSISKDLQESFERNKLSLIDITGDALRQAFKEGGSYEFPRAQGPVSYENAIVAVEAVQERRNKSEQVQEFAAKKVPGFTMFGGAKEVSALSAPQNQNISTPKKPTKI